MNVVLLYGGRSGEHDISIISCSAVARMVGANHSVKLISVDRDGKWYLQDDSALENLKKNPDAKLEINANPKNIVSVVPGGKSEGAFIADGKSIPADVVFPVLHGTNGEDGTVQGLIEMAMVPTLDAVSFLLPQPWTKSRQKSFGNMRGFLSFHTSA